MKPVDLKHWNGPWRLQEVTAYWTDFEGHTEKETYTLWVREYTELSHCDTEGCCELPRIVQGPRVDDNQA